MNCLPCLVENDCILRKSLNSSSYSHTLSQACIPSPENEGLGKDRYNNINRQINLKSRKETRKLKGKFKETIKIILKKYMYLLNIISKINDHFISLSNYASKYQNY